MHEIQKVQLAGTGRWNSAAEFHSQVDWNAKGKQTAQMEQNKLTDLFYLDLRIWMTTKSYERMY